MVNPEKELWQGVLIQAFADATEGQIGNGKLSRSEGRLSHDNFAADSWIRGGGKDFRMVCSLAGIDGDFLRDAYLRGRFRGDWLRMDPKKSGLSPEKRDRANRAEWQRRNRAVGGIGA